MAQTDNELLTNLNVAMIRMDGRLDNIVELLHDLRSSRQDHETRLRLIEATYATRLQIKELEEALSRRIKEIADKPTVSPGTLWKVIGVVVPVVGIFWGIIAFLLNFLR